MTRFLIRPNKQTWTEEFSVVDEEDREVFLARCPFRPRAAWATGAVAWLALSLLVPWLLERAWVEMVLGALSLAFIAMLVGPWYGPLVLILSDHAGRQVVRMRWVPAFLGKVRYRIYRHGSPYGTFRSRGVVNRSYEIEALGHDPVRARGDFAAARWSFYRRDNEIGRAHSFSNDPRDSYNVTVERGEDLEVLLACAATIDVTHRKRKESRI